MSNVGVALSFSCLLLSVSPFPVWGTMASDGSARPKDLVLTLIVSLRVQQTQLPFLRVVRETGSAILSVASN